MPVLVPEPPVDAVELLLALLEKVVSISMLKGFDDVPPSAEPAVLAVPPEVTITRSASAGVATTSNKKQTR